MARHYLILTLCLLTLLSGCVPTPPTPAAPLPTSTFVWQTSTPEEQGMDSATLALMFEDVRARGLDLHSVLVIRNEHIVAEAYFPPYAQETRHELYSCTKSFVSTLVGIAIDRGYIEGVDPAVLSFFPEQTFAGPSPEKEAMTLEHLLTMTSGLEWPEGDPIYMELSRSDDWVGFVLGRPMQEKPGALFNYNSGASHVLSAIVQQTTGARTTEFARWNLFDPLGITDYEWSTDRRDIAIGGWGLRLKPRDMARLGLLYLNGGEWEGQQVVSASWIKAATMQHVDTGGELGYGYQWWTYPSYGAYAALGRDGQMIFVAPEQNVIVVFTAAIDGHDDEFALIEDYILPAVRADEALPADPESQAALAAQIRAVSASRGSSGRGR